MFFEDYTSRNLHAYFAQMGLRLNYDRAFALFQPEKYVSPVKPVKTINSVLRLLLCRQEKGCAWHRHVLLNVNCSSFRISVATRHGGYYCDFARSVIDRTQQRFWW